ncbi:formate/nitrite transporter family protein [Ochrobactrum sp. CM-21-5]|nr:formate/nitrite transporter family protein [Ochrobactrum sp. CM-21-5]MBC2885133.1 formate/nitrite transporter family protein [Ochrobactrum sp. CM-21-5]
MTATKDSAPSAEGLKERLPSKSAAIHELIRRDGEKEMNREAMALLWSAIAGGITMSTSMIARGILDAYLPDGDVPFLISSAGYTVGFIIVIIANQQLFTENTITPVLPFMSQPTVSNFLKLTRLWIIVLFGNLVGCAIAAAIMVSLPIFPENVSGAFVALGRHLMKNSHSEMFAKGAFSGWLIATLVWMLHSVKQGQITLIFLVTYLIAIGDFTHIIVGSAEVMFLLFIGETTVLESLLRFGFPTLLGNIIGGTFIFGLISHAQVRADE